MSICSLVISSPYTLTHIEKKSNDIANTNNYCNILTKYIH